MTAPKVSRIWTHRPSPPLPHRSLFFFLQPNDDDQTRKEMIDERDSFTHEGRVGNSWKLAVGESWGLGDNTRIHIELVLEMGAAGIIPRGGPPGDVLVGSVVAGSWAARCGIAPGDAIAAVNGAPILSLDANSFHHGMCCRPLRLGLGRRSTAAAVFSLTLRRADDCPLGLVVSNDSGGSCLIVDAVLPGGAVDAGNKQCPDSSGVIGACDRIVRINAADDCATMREHCSSRLLLRISVARDALHC